MTSSRDRSFYEEQSTRKLPLMLRLLRLYLKFLGAVWPSKAASTLLHYFLTPRVDKQEIERIYQDRDLFDRGQSSYIDVNNHEIFIYQEGEPKVLLIHGWDSSGHRFQTLMDKLSAEEVGFLFFDLPAHGRSSGKEIHAVMAADIVKSILERYPSVEVIVGHSFGGGVGYLSLEQSSNVSKVIMVATPMNYIAVLEPFFQIFGTKDNVRQRFIDKISDHIGRRFDRYDIAELETADEIDIVLIHDKDDKIIPWMDAKQVAEKYECRADTYFTSGLGHKKIMHDEEVVNKISEEITSVVNQ